MFSWFQEKRRTSPTEGLPTIAMHKLRRSAILREWVDCRKLGFTGVYS